MSVDKALATTLQAYIGTIIRKDLGELTELIIQRYARAVGDNNPLYHDIEVARSAGYDNIVAPPNLIPSIVDWSEGSPDEELRVDGTESGDHLPGIPTSGVRVMGGGEDMYFHAPAIAGTRIRVEGWLDTIDSRESKSGLMLILTYQNRYFDDADRLLLAASRTILLR